MDGTVEYILRKDALRVARGYCHPTSIAKEIEAIPAADVREVVHGRWIKPKNEMEFRCSICNADMKYPSRYCPHCGASMEVEHD